MKFVDLNQKWWNNDIEHFMKLKEMAENDKYSWATKALEEKRERMIKRYGANAMKGL